MPQNLVSAQVIEYQILFKKGLIQGFAHLENDCASLVRNDILYVRVLVDFVLHISLSI